MTKALLPPKGIMIPTALLFEKRIASTVRDTWIQLRALAWGSLETPPVSMRQLEELTGKSARTLYAHLRDARQANLLEWRTATTKSIVVTFPTDDELCKNLQTLILNSNSLTDNVSIKENIKNCVLQKSAKQTCPQEWMQALYRLCGQGNGANTSAGLRARISRVGKSLISSSADIDDVEKFGEWWYEHDWRGKQGSPPQPEQIGDNWHLFKNGNKDFDNRARIVYV